MNGWQFIQAHPIFTFVVLYLAYDVLGDFARALGRRKP